MDIRNQILKSAPEIALIAALFFGWILGRVKVKWFSLGSGAGSNGCMLARVQFQAGYQLLLASMFPP